jgi:hypothetical protein
VSAKRRAFCPSAPAAQIIMDKDEQGATSINETFHDTVRARPPRFVQRHNPHI